MEPARGLEPDLLITNFLNGSELRGILAILKGTDANGCKARQRAASLLHPKCASQPHRVEGQSHEHGVEVQLLHEGVMAYGRRWPA